MAKGFDHIEAEGRAGVDIDDVGGDIDGSIVAGGDVIIGQPPLPVTKGKGDMDESFSKPLGCTVGIVGVLLALASFIVTLLAWLIPFNEIGQSPFAPKEPTQAAVLTTSIVPTSPAPTASPTPIFPLPQSMSRLDALVLYNSIYDRSGWCGLWDRLTDDKLVSGNCPNAQHTVTELINEQTLAAGMEVTINSDIRINYPACANYGTSNELDFSDGYIKRYDDHTELTNVTIHSSRWSFSIYFRCDNSLVLPAYPTKPPGVGSGCPVIVIEGTSSANGKTVLTSDTWSEMQTQWKDSVSYVEDIDQLCSYRSDNNVHIFLGWWLSSDHLEDKGWMTINEAVQLVQDNPGEPVIIVPW